MPLIEKFADEMTIEDRINYLLYYYKVNKPIKIDDDDREMILNALNESDVCRVHVDDEGGLNIEYYGDE